MENNTKMFAAKRRKASVARSYRDGREKNEDECLSAATRVCFCAYARG